MFKTIRKIKLILFILITLGITASIFFIKHLTQPSPENISDNSDISINYIAKDSVVNDIKEVNKIIPLEIRLSETITLDDSWLDLDSLKKYKDITFVADCSYYIDLNKVSPDNLSIDYTNKKVTFRISKPLIYKIDFDDESTNYSETVNGLLRFGDLTLSAEDYGILEDRITKNMSEKMMSSELYSKACSSSIDSLDKLLSNILNDDYDIDIVFLNEDDTNQ